MAKPSHAAKAKCHYLQSLKSEQALLQKSKAYGSKEQVESCEKAITAIVGQYSAGVQGRAKNAVY